MPFAGNKGQVKYRGSENLSGALPDRWECLPFTVHRAPFAGLSLPDLEGSVSLASIRPEDLRTLGKIEAGTPMLSVRA